MDFKDLFHRDVRGLFGARKPAPEAPTEVRCAEASLLVRGREGGVDFVCLLDRAPLFTVAGRIDGPLSVTPHVCPDRGPGLRITVPLRADAEAYQVTVEHRQRPLSCPSDELEASWTLVESTAGMGGLAGTLDFVLERQLEEVRYHCALSGGPVPTGVRAPERRRVRYRPLPSVGQMAAFLGAAARGRGGEWRMPPPSEREPVAWVDSILRQPGPERMDGIVAAWKEASRPPFALSGTDGLEAFVAAAGGPPPPGLVPALCLYVEIEMERLTRDAFEACLAGGPVPGVSPYALEAVAGALGSSILALALPRARLAARPLLETLFSLSPPGLLVGCPSEGETPCFRHAASGEDVDPASLTGDVLLSLPVREHVSVRDLSLFLGAGRDVVACFQSDLDRRRVWRRLSPDRAGCQDFGFVDGFRQYHFQSSVLGRVGTGGSAPPSGEGLVPAGVSIWRDDRESLHFLPADADDQAAAPLARTDLALYLPVASGFPDLLPEMSEARRRGRVEGGEMEVQKLDLLAQALASSLARPDRHRSLDRHPDDLARLRQCLLPERIKPRLGSLVDGRTLDELLALVAQEPPALELGLYEPAARFLGRPEVREAAATALVLEMALSDAVRTRSGFKNFDRSRLRSEILDAWMKLAESRAPDLRAAGSALLGTSAALAERHERPVVIYALNHALDLADEGTAHEAAVSLARLALQEYLPPPRLWEVRASASASASSSARQAPSPLAVEAGRVADEMRQWMGRIGAALFGAPTPPAAASSPRGLALLLGAARLAVPALPDLDPDADRLGFCLHGDLVSALADLLDGWRGGPPGASDLPSEACEAPEGSAFLRHAGAWRSEGTPGAPQDPWMFLGGRCWKARQLLEPVPFWISETLPAGGHRSSPLILALVEAAGTAGLEALRIVRWRVGAGFPGVEVLHAARGGFVPVLELPDVLSDARLGERRRGVLRGLVATGRPPEEDEASKARARAHADAVEAFMDAVADGGAGRALLAAFQLKEAYSPQVARILEGVRGEWERARSTPSGKEGA